MFLDGEGEGFESIRHGEKGPQPGGYGMSRDGLSAVISPRFPLLPQGPWNVSCGNFSHVRFFDHNRKIHKNLGEATILVATFSFHFLPFFSCNLRAPPVP